MSGETGLPVTGAEVSSGGSRWRTDEAGRIHLPAEPYAALDVVAEGFLSRQTRLGAARLTLWPVAPGRDADYVRAIIYRSSAVDTATGFAPDQPLQRLGPTRAVLVPSRDLARDVEAMTALRDAAAMLNEATEGVVTFAVGGPTAGAAAFAVELDPALRWIAAAYRDLRGSAIVGGRLVFSTLDAARRARFVAHELGHTLGLQHSASPADLMYFEARADGASSFTPAERLTIRLLLQRAPGNLYPDNDRDAAPSAAAASVTFD